MIVIHEYRSSWSEEFESIRAALQAILGALATRIDHIGSTSVPGLGAKDVIDIKREIALRHADDLDAYYAIKDPVYDLIWNAALEWARHSGWRPAE